MAHCIVTRSAPSAEKPTALRLFLSFFFCIGIGGFPSDIHSNEPRSEGIRERSQNILDRVNEFLSTNELPPWNLELAQGHEKEYERSHTKRSFSELYHRSNFSFKFNSPDLSLASISNSKLATEITMADAKTFRVSEEAPLQRWSPARAVEVATGFVESCLGSIPANAGPAKAEFSEWAHQGRKKPIGGYRVPDWTVVFPRVDEDGHEFADDQISVSLLEDVGPYFISIEMHSNYEKVDAEPLIESDAFVPALTHARAFGAPPVLARLIGERGRKTDPAPLSTYLRIVNPNHVGRSGLIFGSEPPATNARLAWVFWFGQTDLDSGRKCGVAIWIDAHTGEHLGGDFW